MHGDSEGFAPEETFWTFSLALYGSEGVEAACLELQEQHALHVNLLLLCCWTGRRGVKLDDGALERLLRHCEAWQEVSVAPLRALRRRLKQDVAAFSTAETEPFREQVKALELEAERLEQRMLVGLLAQLPGADGRAAARTGLMRGNLVRYLEAAGTRIDTEVRALLETLVRAAAAID